jgi:hypothetical protein
MEIFGPGSKLAFPSLLEFVKMWGKVLKNCASDISPVFSSKTAQFHLKLTP